MSGRAVLHIEVGILAAALGCTLGCDRGLGVDAPSDLDPPILNVASPDRGTQSVGGGTVRVEGSAWDAESGIASVEVNGQPAYVDANGAFVATLDLEPGLLLLHTVAIDHGGNRTTDTRSILSGTFVPLETPLDKGLAANLSAESFATIASAAETYANQQDLGAMVQPFNPVFQKGVNCLRASLEIADIQTSDIRLSLEPYSGGLMLAAEIDDLDVDMDIPYEANCNDGKTTARLTADTLRISAELDISMANDRFVVEIASARASFQGFALYFAFIPDDVQDLIQDYMDNVVANVLVGQIEKLVAPKLMTALDGVAAGKTIDVLGNPLTVHVTPDQISFTEAGAFVVLDTTLEARRAPDYGVGYLSTPGTMPLMAGQVGFGLAVADDTANQLLSTMWASGSLDRTLPVGGGEYGEVGVLYDSLHLSAMVPPVVLATDSGLRVVLGDLRCALEKVGEPVTVMVVNATADLTVAGNPDGTLSLALDNSAIYVDFEAALGTNALADDQVEMLTSFLGSRALAVLGSLVGNVPVPSVGGLAVTDIEVDLGDSGAGYLVAGGRLVPAE